MNILWLTNKIIPAVAEAMGHSSDFVNEGWISQMFSQLTAEPHVSMTIVCGGGKSYASGKAERFAWFVVPENRTIAQTYSVEQKDSFARILEQQKPDVIHVWGSENSHTYAMAIAARETGLLDRVLISMQGLISVYAQPYYFHCALPEHVVQARTLYDTLRRNGIVDQNERFARRGKWEVAALREVRHVAGRTDWDRWNALALNPDLHYHLCNETLRQEFYSGEWNEASCQRHSIFVSQATYSIKGFHLLLDAMPAILSAFPDAQVVVAGADIRGKGSLFQRIRRSAYGAYLKKSIEEKQLEKHIRFAGALNAAKMKAEYLKSNVFVCCSSIENSPNSVGEAMLLGVPVVCSDVGGVRSIFHAPEEGWTYRWDDPRQLAAAVIDVFTRTDEAQRRAAAARTHARKTHHAQNNYLALKAIYAEIASC